MSRRNALIAAIAAALVVVAFFFWPERARAASDVSARIGGNIGHGSGIGVKVHIGGRAGLHRGTFGHRAFRHGRKHHGVRMGDRFRFHQHQRLSKGRHARHGLLLGDRSRVDRRKRLGGRGLPSRVLLGDLFLFNQAQRLHAEFLRPDFHDGRHGRDRKRHRRDLHGKFLRPKPLLLPYGGADVVVREIIVPVPAPAARPAPVAESAPLDPRGPVRLVGEEDGVLGDWAPGDRLPTGVPHVALDPVSYGLPDPPFGQKYARVGNDVLRIDAGSRRIVEVIAR